MKITQLSKEEFLDANIASKTPRKQYASIIVDAMDKLPVGQAFEVKDWPMKTDIPGYLSALKAQQHIDAERYRELLSQGKIYKAYKHLSEEGTFYISRVK